MSAKLCEEKCLECGIVFRAGAKNHPKTGKGAWKKCPNGHLNSALHLRLSRNGQTEANFQSLQAALREALEGWEDSERQHDYPGASELDRITALRAQFLDDK